MHTLAAAAAAATAATAATTNAAAANEISEILTMPVVCGVLYTGQLDEGPVPPLSKNVIRQKLTICLL